MTKQIQMDDEIDWKYVIDEIVLPNIEKNHLKPADIIKVLQILNLICIYKNDEEIKDYFSEKSIFDLV